MPPLDRALPAEPPKTGGFNPSVLPPNIDTGLEPSAGAVNVNVGFISAELPPKAGTGLEPPVAPPNPNSDTGLGPSPVLEPGLVAPKVNTGVLPEAEVPAGAAENILLAVLVLADADVGLGRVDVEALPSTATGFTEKFTAEVEEKLGLPEVGVGSNDKDLTGSFGPPKTDIAAADFFTSSTAGTTGAESPFFAPGKV